MIGPMEIEERHQEQRERARAVAEREIDPHIDEYEDSGEFPREIIDRLGDEGYHGVTVPEEYGGQGKDLRSFVVTVEELCRSWKMIGGYVSLSGSTLGYPLVEYGAEWQKEEWLTPMVTGDKIGAIALTEPEAGSDAASMTTAAERDGDEWVIDGHKVWTTYGEVADVLIVAVRTGGAGAGGISLVGIPDPGSRDGLTFERDIPCMEGDVAVESEITFDGVRVPAENLIGEEGAGFGYAMEALDLGRIGTAAQGVGVAQASLDASTDFADEREQFGRSIRSFQGISFKLADMHTETEAARLLTLSAAAKYDRGEPVTQEASMAKVFATDTAMDASTEAVQIHGSRGYSTDYPVERHMRMAKGMQIYEGTNEVNRQLIANHLYED